MFACWNKAACLYTSEISLVFQTGALQEEKRAFYKLALDVAVDICRGVLGGRVMGAVLANFAYTI